MKAEAALNPGRTFVALTSNLDGRTLRLWNLLEGRAAYIKRLPGGGDAVAWSPGGGRFAIAVGATLLVHAADGGDAICTLKHPLKV